VGESGVTPDSGVPERRYPKGTPLSPMSNASSLPDAPTPAVHDDRLWACFAHFGGVLGFLPSLVIFLVTRDRSVVVRRESKEALNWQITFTIGYLLLLCVAALISAILALAGLVGATAVLTAVPLLLYAANVVFSIVGGMRVSAGGSYRYPFSVRLIR
jgi:uncharacterized Tic20 family protein